MLRKEVSRTIEKDCEIQEQNEFFACCNECLEKHEAYECQV
jgi:hypothetical protein